jgi:hypothetical protein
MKTRLLILLLIAQAATAAITLIVTAGNAQLVPANFGMGSKNIVVNVQNTGVAVSGATVAITCTIGGSSITPPMTTAAPVTDASGNATLQFVPGTQTSAQTVMEYDCTATYSAVTATFDEIGYYNSPTLIPGVAMARLAPSASAMSPYTATAGSAGTPIKVQVYRQDTFAGVPNVGVKLLQINDGTAGTQQVITTAEGSGPEGLVLTDANGYATLTPTFTYPSSALSSSYEAFNIDIGKFNHFGPFTESISAANSSVLPSSPPATAPNPGVGAHSKWRLSFTAGAPGVSVDELMFFDPTGTQIPTPVTTPVPYSLGVNPCPSPCSLPNSASAVYGADGFDHDDNGSARAFDGVIDTTGTYYWAPSGAAPYWVEYAFPSSVNVASIYLVNHSMTSSTFKLQYSDLGIAWTDATASITETYWSAYSAWGFAVASPAAGSYLSYRLNMSASGTTQFGLAEIAMSTTLGGANIAQAVGPQAFANLAATAAANAFDGNTATNWQSGTATTAWISANFKTPQAIAQITLTPISTAINQAPTAFTVDGSNDGGLTWTVLSTCSMTWGSSTPQTCNVGTATAPPPPSAIVNGNTSAASDRGNIDYDQIAAAVRLGAGSRIPTSDGTYVFGDFPMFSADGTLTDSHVSSGSIGVPVATVQLTAPVAEFNITTSPLTSSGVLPIAIGDAPLLSNIQQQHYTYANDTGAANAYAVTLTPAPTLQVGSVVVFKAVNANTGASTLAVNGGTAIAIKKNATVALASGDIAAGQIITVIYDGTNFQR